MSPPGRWLRWLRRLGATLDPRARERDLAEELESHLQLDVDERVRHGADPESARREALLALGGVEPTKERVRDQSRLRALESIVQDVRFALRTLAKDRIFTAVVIFTFALGLGANTAIFGAVNAVLLQPLPYPDGDQLVGLWAIDRRAGHDTRPVTPADYADWRAATRSFSAIAASSDSIVTLTGQGEPESLIGYRFAPEMFPLFGIPAALGRTFEAADGAQVVVLSDRLWRRRFQADPRIIGRAIRLDQKSYNVVGVMPPAFRHPSKVELWTPLVIPPDEVSSRSRQMLRLVARLRPGVTVEQARAELRTVAANLAEAHPETNRQRGADVISLRTAYSGDARPALLVLLGAVGFVLLLTCSNIAGLSLARAARRGREIAVRTALGAGRRRIVQQLLTESLLLALVGGAAGLVLAMWGAELLVGLFPKNVSNLKIPNVEHIPLDGPVALFSFGATLVAGVLAGLIPAIRGSRTDLNQALKEGSRGAARSSRLRPVLVAAQISLALMLSTGAGLLIRSSLLHRHALGFDSERLFTSRVLLDKTRYPEPAQRRQFLDDLVKRLRTAPGVQSAGVVSFLPLCGWSSGITFFDLAHPGAEREAGALIAEPGYFTTMHIPVVRGRPFAAGDTASAPKVILVDSRFVRTFFGDTDPIGVRLNLGDARQPDWQEIIGVTGDVENDPPPDPQRPMIYLPFSQNDSPFFGVVARTGGDVSALAAAVRDTVWSIDRDQPVSYAVTMDTLVADAFAVDHTSTWILSFFAVLAVALAAMGIYGVIAHSVLERRREIGIRMALGAPRSHVLALMLRRLALMTGTGIVIGLAVTLAGARALQAMLYGVSARDPLLLIAVVLLLSLVALLAAYVPLRRAVRTDPMVALRED
ncbi:MAG: macrolide transporter ATP-binding/permease protein [Myxococcales bacterium]|nr:macrolide transporter ATP-binding/permease protein [Myxococcales bacterium]